VEYTKDLESPEICRRWTAIGTLAAVMQQKLSVTVGSGIIWPNMYIWLVSTPGIGKSIAIKEARKFIQDLDKIYIAPTNVSSASLIDFVAEARCILTPVPGPAIQYNSAILLPDELMAFMATYDTQMIGLLTTLYDTDVPYGEDKRTLGTKHRMERPQLNMIVGTTPSNIMTYVPQTAWDQGFTSRIVLVWATKRKDDRDIFAVTARTRSAELEHDIRVINSTVGKFDMEESFKQKVRDWRAADYPPAPTHPRLTHYLPRRLAHFFKLAMVSSIDRGPSLVLTMADWERATKWLFEAEATMPIIFEQGITHSDTGAQNELAHFIRSQKGEISETQLVRKARTLLPVYAVTKTIEVLEKSGVIQQIRYDVKARQKIFKAGA